MKIHKKTKLNINEEVPSLKDKKLQRKSWDKYVSYNEYDVQGAQNQAYEIMKHLNKSEKDTVQINNISKE